MRDPTSRIRFSSIFPKKTWITLCKTDLDGLVRVWPDVSGLEASRCAVSHFETRFRSSADVLDNIAQSQPGSDLVLADCVRFWAKRIRSGSKPMCKNHPARFRPMLHSRSGPDANRIRHVYCGNTGSLHRAYCLWVPAWKDVNFCYS